MEGDYTGIILVGPEQKPMNVILDTGSSALALDGTKYVPDLNNGDQTTVLVLQLYFTQFLENGRRPGPKGHVNSPSFRGLKPPAPSGIFDLQL
jgi:hypothetical protein